MAKLKFADAVSFRLVQIFQEAMIYGMDGADLLREVVLTTDPSDPNTLVLDPEYVDHVKETHEKMEARGRELHASKLGDQAKIVIVNDEGTGEPN